MSVPEHLERHLGRIGGGWKSPTSPEGLSVAYFPNQPYSGVTTLATLGLSHHVLHLSDKSVRQELLFGLNDGYPTEELSMMLLHISEMILRDHHAPARGEVLPVGGPLLKGAEARDLYASMPALYPDGLAGYYATTPPTVIVWLFPILPSETKWVQENGWSSFEDILEEKNPDFFDLMREPVC